MGGWWTDLQNCIGPKCVRKESGSASELPAYGTLMGGQKFQDPKLMLLTLKISNFQAAQQKLFMLVSALMGLELMKEAYAHAIENGYRFYSYGDASLLLPESAS
jgi:hypothetical protein